MEETTLGRRDVVKGAAWFLGIGGLKAPAKKQQLWRPEKAMGGERFPGNLKPGGGGWMKTHPARCPSISGETSMGVSRKVTRTSIWLQRGWTFPSRRPIRVVYRLVDAFFLQKGVYFPAEFESAAGFAKGPEWRGDFSAAPLPVAKSHHSKKKI